MVSLVGWFFVVARIKVLSGMHRELNLRISLGSLAISTHHKRTFHFWGNEGNPGSICAINITPFPPDTTRWTFEPSPWEFHHKRQKPELKTFHSLNRLKSKNTKHWIEIHGRCSRGTLSLYLWMRSCITGLLHSNQGTMSLILRWGPSHRCDSSLKCQLCHHSEDAENTK